MRPVRLGVVAALATSALLGGSAATAIAATYEVGPGKTYQSITQVRDKLAPGDVVLVQGNFTYAGETFVDRDGSPSAPVTLRGVRVNGKRPVLTNPTGNQSLFLAGNNYVVEGFDIVGAIERAVWHQADNVTIRDTVIHDCPKNGVHGSSNLSGSLTLEYVEIYNCGNGAEAHQIYMHTDQARYPNAVFRVAHSYIHNGKGGHNIKSRASRTELYYNWLEDGWGQEIELIGADPVHSPEAAVREDADVVGNVFVKHDRRPVARFGGDGSGQSNGRYRLAFNTMWVQPAAEPAIRLERGVESISLDNNVFYAKGGPVDVLKDTATWTLGRAVSGERNWITSGSYDVPPEWTGTLAGTDPRVTNLGGMDFRPASGSPLIDAAAKAPSSPRAMGVPRPLVTPAFHPPQRRLEAAGAGVARKPGAAPDIGAFEFGHPFTAGPDVLNGATGVDGSTGSSTGRAGAVWLARTGRKRLTQPRRGGMVLRAGFAIGCAEGGPTCTTVVTAKAGVRSPRGKRVRVVLARRTFSVKSGARRTVFLRLSKKASRAVRRSKRVRIVLTFKSRYGGANTTERRVITLPVPRRR